MASSFPGIIEELRRLDASVFGESHSGWGSESEGHRQEIRLNLQNALAKAGAQDLEQITDLRKAPRISDFSISISHTKGFGAWLACERPNRIGFDIENAARISREVCARVCSETEMSAAPRFEFLWCAKEAYFKALEKDQPAIITPLRISNWEKQKEGLFAFEASYAQPAYGFVLELPPYILAACLIRDVSS